MKRILSTKLLTVSQKERLLNAEISLVEYNAIKIEDIAFSLDHPVENAIITSQNAVIRLKKFKSMIQNVFCVGDKTAALLEEYGFKVVIKTLNAKDLASIICKHYKEKRFTFFCGNRRRNELPELLKDNSVLFDEKTIYKTDLNTKNITGTFDGILFFSPSGVLSYFSKNKIGNAIAFCIGATTTKEITKYTEKYIMSNRPTVENLLVQTIKSLKTN